MQNVFHRFFSCSTPPRRGWFWLAPARSLGWAVPSGRIPAVCVGRARIQELQDLAQKVAEQRGWHGVAGILQMCEVRSRRRRRRGGPPPAARRSTTGRAVAPVWDDRQSRRIPPRSPYRPLASRDSKCTRWQVQSLFERQLTA